MKKVEDNELVFGDDNQPTQTYPSPEEIMIWCEEAQEQYER